MLEKLRRLLKHKRILRIYAKATAGGMMGSRPPTGEENRRYLSVLGPSLRLQGEGSPQSFCKMIFTVSGSVGRVELGLCLTLQWQLPCKVSFPVDPQTGSRRILS